MKANFCIAVAGCVLASCQPMVIVGQGANTRAVALANPGLVIVTVVESGSTKVIQFNQDPVPAVNDPATPGNKMVRWELANLPGQNYKFLQPPPAGTSGINICPNSKPKCSPGPSETPRCSSGATTVVCTWKAPPAGVIWPYAIHVVGVPVSDPSIMN